MASVATVEADLAGAADRSLIPPAVVVYDRLAKTEAEARRLRRLLALALDADDERRAWEAQRQQQVARPA